MGRFVLVGISIAITVCGALLWQWPAWAVVLSGALDAVLVYQAASNHE